YLELLIALGAGTARLCGGAKPERTIDFLACFVLGLCVWSLCAWTASALGFGSLKNLRWLTLLLAIPAWMARSRPWIVHVEAQIARHTRNVRFCAGALLGCFLVLFARSATVVGFDGLWYGLRGEYVLVGAGSVFVNEGLVSPVFYFPKLYELLLIPVSALGSNTVIVGMTILTGVMLAAASYEVLKRLGMANVAMRYLMIAAALSVPAVANTMLEVKGDVLAAFLIVFAWIKLGDFLRSRDTAAWLWMAALLLLASQARLTSIPFAAMLFVGSLVGAMVVRPARIAANPAANRTAFVACALALIVTMFVSARTLILTGLPTIGPDPLVRLWEIFGLQLHPPAGTLQWSLPKDWNDIVPLAIDLFFRPQVLEHIVITWVGNLWVWCALLAFVFGLILRSRPIRSREEIVGWSLVAVALGLMFLWGYQVRGGDGNYFIAGLIPAVLLSTLALWRMTDGRTLARNALVGAVAATTLFHFAYSFTSAAWVPGTRGFDLKFGLGARTFRHRGKDLLEHQGIGEIANYLQHHHGVERVVGDVDYMTGFYLPARFEDFMAISFSRPELVKDADLFFDYMKANDIDYFIMPHDKISQAPAWVAPILRTLVARFAADPQVAVIHDRNYDLYDLSRRKR
ncbi:MAG TPA: hypothetical protein VF132_12900, partial [Rudaea sp.]